MYEYDAGHIPGKIGNLTFLEGLFLSNNNMTGMYIYKILVFFVAISPDSPRVIRVFSSF